MDEALSGSGRAFRPETLAVRGGLSRSAFDETSEAMFLTSGFVYESAEQAEAAFKDEVEKFIYSRYGNPTVSMFEERLRLLEGAEACFATASGMAAVWVALAALCGEGDRIVSSRALFGSCFVIIDEILPRFGVEAVFVDGTDLAQWQEALSEPSGDHPLWAVRPSWFVFGEEDRNIPAELMYYMADRARAHRTLEIPGASHAVTVAHPKATAHMILEAATARAVV